MTFNLGSEHHYLSRPDNRLKLALLAQMIEQWGGQMVQTTEAEFDQRKAIYGWSEAPFSSYDLAVHHVSRTILYTDPNTPWPHVLHEMAHVFACKEEPNHSKEFDFFGWEYTIAAQLGDLNSWLLFNRDYNCTPDGDELKDLTALQLLAVLAERIGKAYELGLVQAGQAVSIR